VDIENALSHLSPDGVWKKPLRIHQCVVDSEVFFERDFAFHIGSPNARVSCNGVACLVSNGLSSKKPPRGRLYVVLHTFWPRGREGWWSQGEANPRPRECHSRALPLDLWPQFAISSAALRIRRKDSALFFFFDRLADDVGYVGVAFFLLLDEGRIVEALVAHLDFLFLACRGRLGGSRLLALVFGLGVLERNEFGVGGLRYDGFGLRRCRTRRRYGFGSRARRGWRSDWYDFACIRRNHRRLVEVVELTTSIGTNALGAEIGFSH